tara:strand:+ start:125 stop:1636 length:1512 start_codon:yes stop_codon:yes gene_type:complete
MAKIKYLLGILLSVSIINSSKFVHAEIKKDISAIAKNINVKIYGPANDGTGVIIKRDLNKYLVLTSWHVLKDLTSRDELNLETNDKFLHSYSKGSINKIKNVDLGVFNFESSNNYEVAEIGEVANSKMLDEIYVFGFPLPNKSIEKSFARLQPGQITANSNSYNKDGYQLLYTNKTLPGMSGGSILNINGKLIGIHGRSEIDEINSYGNKLVSTGTNMGIPISYFENYISKDKRNKENKSSQADGFSVENKSSQADGFLLEAFNLRNTEDNALKMLLLAKKSVEIKPNALGFALMGRAQEILNDSNAALKNYKKAIELNPNIELANKYLAQRLPNKEAIKIYEKLTKDYPKNNKYFYASALRKLDDGDINGSLEDLENGLKIYLSLPKNYCKKFYSFPQSYQETIRSKECHELKDTHQHLLERAGNTLFVLNKTKKSCMYWKDRFENYFWGSKMWEESGFLGNPDKFLANNENYNIQRAKEMSYTFSKMNLEKYLYKYCLDYI